MSKVVEHSDPDQPSYAEIDKVLRKHCVMLMEHGDSVRIVLTRKCVDEDGEDATEVISQGCGNYYAQVGSVQRWIEKQKD